jgi:hypothetical protein
LLPNWEYPPLSSTGYFAAGEFSIIGPDVIFYSDYRDKGYTRASSASAPEQSGNYSNHAAHVPDGKR